MAVNGDPVSIENLKGALSLGAQTVKSLEIINGGAVLAILTFYGNAVKDGAKVPFDRACLSLSLVIFAVGLAFAVAAACCGYVGQVTVATNEPDTPMDEKGRRAHLARQLQTSKRTIRVALVLALGSLVMFVAGTIFAARALFTG